MNQKRRDYNANYNKNTAIIAIYRDHGQYSSLKFPLFTELKVAHILGILPNDKYLELGIESPDNQEIKLNVINEVRKRIKYLGKISEYSNPTKSSLLKNGQVIHENVDSESEPYVRASISRSGKSMMVSYRTHQEQLCVDGYFEDYQFSEPKAFPRNISWSEILMYISSLGNKVSR